MASICRSYGVKPMWFFYFRMELSIPLLPFHPVEGSPSSETRQNCNIEFHPRHSTPFSIKLLPAGENSSIASRSEANIQVQSHGSAPDHRGPSRLVGGAEAPSPRAARHVAHTPRSRGPPDLAVRSNTNHRRPPHDQHHSNSNDNVESHRSFTRTLTVVSSCPSRSSMSPAMG